MAMRGSRKRKGKKRKNIGKAGEGRREKEGEISGGGRREKRERKGAFTLMESSPPVLSPHSYSLLGGGRGGEGREEIAVERGEGEGELVFEFSPPFRVGETRACGNLIRR